MTRTEENEDKRKFWGYFLSFFFFLKAIYYTWLKESNKTKITTKFAVWERWQSLALGDHSGEKRRRHVKSMFKVSGNKNTICFSFFSFICISWRLITLQYCSGFCHTLIWISYGFTCAPHLAFRVLGCWDLQKQAHHNPLQYSCLENPLDRGGWRATVHRVEKSRTWLKQLSTHAQMTLLRIKDASCKRVCYQTLFGELGIFRRYEAWFQAGSCTVRGGTFPNVNLSW